MPRKHRLPPKTTKGKGKKRPPHRGEAERIAQRQAKAIDLRKRGLTYQAIGTALGVSIETAYSDVQSVLREVAALRQATAEEFRELEAARLDAMQEAISSKVRRGVIAAIEAARKISESRRRLYGVDAPTKIAPTNPAGDQPYRDLSKLTDAELAQAEKLARRLEATQ